MLYLVLFKKCYDSLIRAAKGISMTSFSKSIIKAGVITALATAVFASSAAYAFTIREHFKTVKPINATTVQQPMKIAVYQLRVILM